jgi:hypothetical protein
LDHWRIVALVVCVFSTLRWGWRGLLGGLVAGPLLVTAILLAMSWPPGKHTMLGFGLIVFAGLWLLYGGVSAAIALGLKYLLARLGPLPQ